MVANQAKWIMQTCEDYKPNIENKRPDCLYLDLQISANVNENPNRLTLDITINFNEQEEILPLGKIRFGIRGGELRLKLSNGSVLSRGLIHKLELAIPNEISISNGHETNLGGEISFPAPEKGSMAKLSGSGKSIMAKTEKSMISLWQVSTKGDNSEPAWVFRLRNLGEEVLIGTLQDRLCEVIINDEPFKLEAVFRVSKEDVWITGSYGLWTNADSRNKNAALGRFVLLKILMPRLENYLSRLDFSLDSNDYASVVGDLV